MKKMMKSKYLWVGACCAAMAVVSQKASAQFTAAYPTDSATVVGSVGIISPGLYGYFWTKNRGDGITEAFTGTGLTTVDSLSLRFPVPENGLSGDLTWNVLVNGVSVGGWDINGAAGTPTENLSYSFPAITGNGNYTIAMLVSDVIAPGDGAITIGTGSFTLTGTSSSSVPDFSNTFILLGISVMALAGF
jgi:hypothetical protein